MTADDFMFLGIEEMRELPKAFDEGGKVMSRHRVYFTYLGKHGYGDVNISDVLAADPKFNLVDIATTIVRNEVERKSRQNEQAD